MVEPTYAGLSSMLSIYMWLVLQQMTCHQQPRLWWFCKFQNLFQNLPVYSLEGVSYLKKKQNPKKHLSSLHIITPHYPSHTLFCCQSLDLQINYPHPKVNEGTTCMLLDSICTAFFNKYSTRLQVTRPCRQAHARRNYRETIQLCELDHFITGKWGHRKSHIFKEKTSLASASSVLHKSGHCNVKSFCKSG